jgi:nucleotide-binding universal stress UspA family protein
MKPFRRILVTLDGSDTSRKALVAALQIARDAGGRVQMLHVFNELAYLNGFEASGQIAGMAHDYGAKVLAQGAEIAQAAGVEHEERLLEEPGRGLGQVVADAARDWDADLLVVGSHGRRGFDRLVLGSGAEKIIRQATVPVLVIRGSDDER